MQKIPKEVLKAFNIVSETVCFKSGQGTTHLCGEKVLKPTDNKEEAEWIAKLFSSLDNQKTFKFPRPIRSINKEWVVNGWVAWEYIPGEVTGKDKFQEQFQVCDDFHIMLKFVEKPYFIEKRIDPWSIADRVAWQEIDDKYDSKFMELINEIKCLLHPVKVSNQLIHGDLLGNILFSKGTLPAVIDFSFYWRPVEFAKAVMIIDAFAWGKADNNVLKSMRGKNAKQLLLRAILRRIVEQAEHVKQSGKDTKEALNESMQNYKIVERILNFY